MCPECNKAWAGNVQLPPVMNTDISWGNTSVLLQPGCAHRSPEGQHTETPHPACILKIIVASMSFQWRICKFWEFGNSYIPVRSKVPIAILKKYTISVTQKCIEIIKYNHLHHAKPPTSCRIDLTNFNPKFFLQHKFTVLPIPIISTTVTDYLCLQGPNCIRNFTPPISDNWNR
jgi:hypothetical protein